jgi:hypothetical protein
MKLMLLKPARINHAAGDIVEVSPAQASFLISVGSAQPVEIRRETTMVTAETPEKKAPRKTTKK